MKMQQVAKMMERVGIPGQDAYDLPTSDKRFPDGRSIAWRSRGSSA
jgi:hypothetical protein